MSQGTSSPRATTSTSARRRPRGPARRRARSRSSSAASSAPGCRRCRPPGCRACRCRSRTPRTGRRRRMRGRRGVGTWRPRTVDAARQAAESLRQIDASERFSPSSSTANASATRARVLGEQALDELLAARRDGDHRGPLVREQAAPGHQAARLEGRDDLVAFAFEVRSRARSVRSSSSPPAVVRTTRTEKPVAETPSRSRSAVSRRRTRGLGAQQRVERAVGKRVAGHEGHVASGAYVVRRTWARAVRLGRPRSARRRPGAR